MMQSNNDYSIRMRDIAFQERLKKMTERYTTELDHNREQYETWLAVLVSAV